MSVDVCVTDYGAKPDGSLQTGNIQRAIDDCFARGGGTVTVPSGEFLTGGLRLRSNITLKLLKGAVLKGTRDIKEYFGYRDDKIEPLDENTITDVLWTPENTPNRNTSFLTTAGSRWNNALIRIINAENVAVIGEEGSLIDGCDPYDENNEEYYRGPHGINAHCVKGLTLKGYTIQNTGNWAHSVYYSSDIVVNGVTVIAGHDGVHFSSCDNITVTDCSFSTGDDCVAGFDNNDVVVRNCTMNSACSALRFGGNNVLVENCHMYGPAKHIFRGGLTTEEKRSGAKPDYKGDRKMLSVFTYYSDFSLKVRKTPGNIVIKNCKVENSLRFLHYNFSGNEPWQKNRPLTSIRFEDITASGISMPIHAYGSENEPLTLVLSNVKYTMNGGNTCNEFIKAANISELTLENVTVDGFEGDTIIASWGNVDTVTLKNFNLSDDPSAAVTDRTDKFECGAI